MIFDPPLVPGVLLRRYKRFLADVRLPDDRVVVAHCTNTGRMTGCSAPGSDVLLSPADNPKRKLAWTLRLVRVGRSWVSVDTMVPNRVVAEALRRRRVPELATYDRVRTEVPIGKGSRIDIVLEDSTDRAPVCYVEVKNVTMRQGRAALFPDAVSERGLKHLRELARLARDGHRAVLFPFVARGDCQHFDAAREVDPDWAEGLLHAAADGVEIMPWRARVDRLGVRLGRPLPWSGAPEAARA
jgi:sugar fermentation stimulation protein A